MSTVLALDGTNLAHRAWHAARNETDPALSLLAGWSKRAAQICSATSAVVCFDGADAGRWRYSLLPEYKSGRSAKDDTFRSYLAAAPSYLRAQGWTVFEPSGFEADDVLDTVVKSHPQVVVCTSDKDAFSLAVSALILRPGQWELLDRSAVADLAGVDPGRYRFFCAIKGDSSDKIPGVRGLGPKAALALAAHFANVDDFLDDLRSGGALTALALGDKPSARLCARVEDVSAQALLSDAVLAPEGPPSVPLGPVPG